MKRAISLTLAAIFLLAATGCSAAKTDGGNMYDANMAAGYSASGRSETTAAVTTAADMKYSVVAEAPAAEGDAGIMIGPMEPPFLPQSGDWNAEEYAALEENGYSSVALSPLSTFSVDVDTASYTNVRRMILSDRLTDPAVIGSAVRAEEFINFFKYDYDAPDAGSGVPFAVTTEYSDCPWNDDAKLLLVGMRAAELDLSEAPRSNLVFLIDVSGSMDSPDKLPLVQRAFTLLAENLRKGDRISVVVYAGSDAVLLEGADGADSKAITDVIDSLFASGSTHGSAGIMTAYNIARKYYIEGGNNRVILATDGDLNVGVTSEGELKNLVEDQRNSGVFLSVLGFGTGNLKDNKLETLADNGNGSYHYIDSVAEARRVLVEEAGGTLYTVAKDVKLQIEFNPAKVKGYRLIGYEDRLLDAEDFADDTKDAGEIGAGHRVTALYEIIPVGSAIKMPTADLKYQTAAATDSSELLTVSVRYKEPDGDKSALLEFPVEESSYTTSPSADFRLASAVALFAMTLRGSGYIGGATVSDARDLIASVPGVSDDPYTTELLYMADLLTAANN